MASCRISRTTVALICAAFAAGCAAEPRPTTTDGPRTTTVSTTSVATLPVWTGADISSAVLAGGILRLDDRGCLASEGPDGTLTDVVWPDGFQIGRAHV